MSATKLASRYAKSILDLAIEQNKVDQVLNDMRLLNNAVDSNRDFYLMLKSPIVNGDKKMEVVLKAFHTSISEMTENFIGILMRKNRESYLPEIIDEFINQYNLYKHITPVKITTAQQISPEMQNTLIDKLKSTAGLQFIELTTAIDESLIGGYVLQWEDKLIDNSISRGLAMMKDEFDNNDYVRKF